MLTQIRKNKNQQNTWLIFSFHMVSELFRKQTFSSSIVPMMYKLNKIVNRASFNSRQWYLLYAFFLLYVVYFSFKFIQMVFYKFGGRLAQFEVQMRKKKVYLYLYIKQ